MVYFYIFGWVGIFISEFWYISIKKFWQPCFVQKIFSSRLVLSWAGTFSSKFLTTILLINLKRSSKNAYVHSSSHTYDHCYDSAKTFQLFIITFVYLLCLFIVCSAGRNIKRRRDRYREKERTIQGQIVMACVCNT